MLTIFLKSNIFKLFYLLLILGWIKVLIDLVLYSSQRPINISLHEAQLKQNSRYLRNIYISNYIQMTSFLDMAFNTIIGVYSFQHFIFNAK